MTYIAVGSRDNVAIQCGSLRIVLPVLRCERLLSTPIDARSENNRWRRALIEVRLRLFLSIPGSTTRRALDHSQIRLESQRSIERIRRSTLLRNRPISVELSGESGLSGFASLVGGVGCLAGVFEDVADGVGDDVAV